MRICEEFLSFAAPVIELVVALLTGCFKAILVGLVTVKL